MLYARFLTVATIVSVLCTPACSSGPVEIIVDPTVDPCADLVVESTPYHDEHDEPILPGGTVHRGGTAGHLLHFEPGQTIATVRVRIVPQRHEGELPPFLPTVDIRRETEIGDGPAVYAADPFQARRDANDATVATDYEAPHDLVIEPLWITEQGADYFVGIGGESGPGAKGFIICGTSVGLN